MYATKPLGLVLVVALLASGGLASGQTAGTAFTFQGKLEHPPGTPAGGAEGADFDFCFTLYDACTDGGQVGTPICMEGENAVTVTDGIFTVDLDFGGGVFVGDLRCLEVAVRETGVGGYIGLSPLQELRPTPYALTPVNPLFPVITGGGTENRISKFDGPQSITDSNIYDVDGYIGIGVSDPQRNLDVNGNIHASSTISSGSSITIDGLNNTISTGGTISFVDDDLETTGAITTGGLTVDGLVGGTGFSGWDTSASNDVTTSMSFSGDVTGPYDATVVDNLAGDVTGHIGATVVDNLAGDVTGHISATIVGDDTHNHTDDSVSDDISIDNGLLYAVVGEPNVGIGNDTPSSKLDVEGTVTANGLIVEGTVTANDLTVNTSVSGTGFSGWDRDASDDVTTSTDFLGDVTGTYDATIVGNDSHNHGDGSVSDDISIDNGLLYAIADGTEVGIGTDSPQETLHVDGTARIDDMPLAAATYTVYADANGKLHKAGSSKRYKTRIADLETDPDVVLRLNPVRFQWKRTGEQDIGLIAEEVDEVIKDLVAYDQDGRPEAVKYDRLSLYLLAVLRELKAENDAVKERLEGLERKALRQQPGRQSASARYEEL